ncbi:DUF4384 domain-containing protein [Deinococcus marmoris]|uniref:S-layer-like array-related protein n=1 Tax=Deinococcus marmoris TaxID=249408 RepID=A0A1U7NXY1_9DEIO|nr:DUF4384 domain-containing protein [Deinococcus marmoris]OLV17785.1 S-layer-like array-related protein [Deinococcus marmoris]
MRKLAILASVTLALTACGGSPSPQADSNPVLNVSVNPATPQAGQNITFTVSLTGGSGTWNVALFNQNPDGSVDQVYPNRLPEGQPTLTPGATLNFPPPEAKYVFVAAGPMGTNTLLAYATQKPLDLEGEGLSRYDNSQAQFASVVGQGFDTLSSLRAKLKLVFSGISKVIQYEVISPASTP